MSSPTLAEWLLSKGHLTPDQVRTAPNDGLLDAWLLQQHLVTFDEILVGLGEVYGVPAVRLSDEEVDASLLELLPTDMVRTCRLLPISRVDEDTARVAMADPADAMSIEFLTFSLGVRTIERVVVSSWDIDLYFERLDAATREFSLSLVDDTETREMVALSFTDEELLSFSPVKEGDAGKKEEENQLGPAIRVVTSLLTEAVAQRASDIHFEPVESGLQVRYRIDGHLREITELPQVIQPMILSRLKLSANLDISERRRPQDGRTRIQVGDKVVDFRVSTLPTYFGEKVVLRILDNSKGSISIDNLGFGRDDLDSLLEIVRSPLGMILITGPTGSGKTTTLYAALTTIHDPKTNIVTVEDPVEYQIFGVNQVAVNPKSGLTFSGALRSILRQDPDVVMIGEIRDLETACIAFEAAMTGHLVLSTLHTNDAPSAVTRLIHLGVPKYLVASSLLGVLAQRLVRKICPSCRTEVEPTEEQLDILRRSNLARLPSRFYGGSGCKSCFDTGYAGRTGLYELLRVTSGIKSLIYTESSDRQYRDVARRQGMRTLLEDGMVRVETGQVTIDEVLSVAPAGTEAAPGGAPSEMSSTCSPAEPVPSSSRTHFGAPPSASGTKPTGERRDDSSRGAGRILAVGEDAADLHLVRGVLEREGFEVTAVGSSREALAAALEAPPDLVLADVDMIETDGPSLCRKLRIHGVTRGVPIILLTPLGDSSGEGAALVAGADDCLTRPIDTVRLVLRVETLLRRVRGGHRESGRD